MVNTFYVHYGLTPALVNDMYGGLKSIVNTEGAMRSEPTNSTARKARTAGPEATARQKGSGQRRWAQPASKASALRAPQPSPGHLIGYARVSTADQDTAIQEAKLRVAGCTLIRTEKASGRSREGRSELDAIVAFIRPGDALVVVKLDRLGRSTRDVLNLVHELDQRGASLRVLEPVIDTGGPMGRMVLTVLGMVAEMELGFIKDRSAQVSRPPRPRGSIREGRPPSTMPRSSP